VVLDLLGCGDESDVANCGVGCIFDTVLSFGNESADRFAVYGVGVIRGAA